VLQEVDGKEVLVRAVERVQVVQGIQGSFHELFREKTTLLSRSEALSRPVNDAD
jgi:hypothetical protein